MAKSVELLLVESVENVGIVGDVVKVRTGFARNFLLPRALATVPSDDLIKSLQSKRAQAEAEVSRTRSQRAETVEKLKGYALELTRSCNDQGILYGAVTQQEIAAALVAAGFGVRPRDVRLSGAIKRVDHYDIHVKFETELETWIKLDVKPDRVLAKDEKPEMDLDAKGRPIMIMPETAEDKKKKADAEAKKAAVKAAGKDGEEGAEATDEKGEKAPRANRERSDRGERGSSEKDAKAKERADKAARRLAMEAEAMAPRKAGWGEAKAALTADNAEKRPYKKEDRKDDKKRR